MQLTEYKSFLQVSEDKIWLHIWDVNVLLHHFPKILYWTDQEEMNKVDNDTQDIRLAV